MAILRDSSPIKHLDEDIYRPFHRQLLTRPTRREKQQQQDTTSTANQSSLPRITEIRVHFTFESGPMFYFKRELKSLWQKHYVENNPQMSSVRLSVNSTSNRNLTQLLVKKKPAKELVMYVIPDNATTGNCYTPSI